MEKFITLEYIQIEFQSYCLYYAFKRFKYKSERSHKFPDIASVVSQETISLWKKVIMNTQYWTHIMIIAPTRHNLEFTFTSQR